MQDLEILLPNNPGALAHMGEVLGSAGISLEGGGVWSLGAQAVAHFLVEDGIAATKALQHANIQVKAVHDVLTLRLRQDVPGQLGHLAKRMAEAKVNIEVQYSDHDHQLILVVDDYQAGLGIANQWMEEFFPEND